MSPLTVGKRNLAALCLVVAGAAQVVGCSTKQCTLIGCGPPFEVRFQFGEGKWSAGTYTIRVTADGTTGSCDQTLPFVSCQSSSLVCTGTREWELESGGCALPPDQHAIYGIVFGTTPVTVDVSVSTDDRQLGQGTFTPSYQSSQPNGPGCGDTTSRWLEAGIGGTFS
jgi:hypothetical protein